MAGNVMEAKTEAFTECEPKEKVAMIKVFTPLFKEFLVPSKILHYMSTFSRCEREDIIKHEEKTSRSEAVEKMITSMLVSSNPDDAIDEFIYALKNADETRTLETLLDPEDVRRDALVDRREYFDFIVLMLEYRLKDMIVPSTVVDYLVEEGCLDEEDKEDILAMQRTRGAIKACRFLFERLPSKSSRWPLGLFIALERSGNQPLLAKIHADALTRSSGQEGAGAPQSLTLQGQGPGRTPQGVMGAPPSRPPVAMEVDTERAEHSDDEQTIPKELDNRARYSNVTEENESEMGDNDDGDDTADEETRTYQPFSDSETEEKQEKEETEKDRYGHYAGPVDIAPRQFQEELAEPALHGKNTVVCAPTGSGKTRVALLIIKNHLESSPPDGPPRKVLFLARTVPLVHQQHRTLKKYLQGYKVFRCSGRDEHNRFLFKYIEQNDVFVLTPQILVNQLKEQKIESLSAFSLMVLDECHHTRKGEPYNALMMMYLCSKIEFPNKPLPQVVGLTASMGVEKSEREDAAVESTMKLLSALDAQSLSTVVEHIEELKQLVPVPEEHSVRLGERLNDPGRERIESAIQAIEKILLETEDFKTLNLEAGTKKYVASLDSTDTSNGGSDLITRGNKIRDKNSQAYGQWASMLKHAAKMVVTKNHKERKASRDLYAIAENLSVYNTALEVLEMVRVEDVLKTLEGKLGKSLAGDKTKKSKVDKRLMKQYEELKKALKDLENQSKGKVNPNLEVLAKTLRDMMQEESRCIIFVRTRATCFALAHWLRSDVPDLAHAMATPLVGQGAREEEWGMEMEKQDKIIEKFRSGEVKLLVATSVAEEGLDIPDCNLVVRYNHVGNEISTVQMRGRCRKEHGKSVLVAREKIHEKESLNVIRAEMMKKAAEKIRAMEPEQFKKGITEKQKEVVRQFRQEEIARQRKPVHKAATPFTFCCSKCKEFAVNGNDVIIVNNSHRIVLAPDFKRRIAEIPEDRSGRPFDGLRIIGRINCAHCEHPWGKLFKYGEQTFPALSIKAFITKEREDGETKCWKKWTLLPYALREITMETLYSELHGGTAPPEPEPMESA